MAESTPNQNFVVMSLLVWLGKVFLSEASYFSIHCIKFFLKKVGRRNYLEDGGSPDGQSALVEGSLAIKKTWLVTRGHWWPEESWLSDGL